MKQILLALTVIYSMFFVTACPARINIDKAKTNSAKVARYANAGVDLTRELFRSNFLTLAQKDKIADAWIVLANAGIAFDTAIANLEQQYPQTGVQKVPKVEIEKLFAVFNSTVVSQFLEILTSLKLIDRLNNYAVIIESIKAAILIIAGAFGQRKTIAAKIG